jgi:hypothetical protein
VSAVPAVTRPTLPMLRLARRAGWTAGNTGLGAERNPYTPSDPRWHEWQAGHEDGRAAWEQRENDQRVVEECRD